MPEADLPSRPHRSALRVVHVDHTTEHGGAELALARLLALPDRGWEAVVVIPSDTPAGVFGGEDSAFRVLGVGPAQAPGASQAGGAGAIRVAWGLFRQALAIRRSRVTRTADVVHANSTRAAVYAALALWGTRVPFVVHLRDRIEPDALGRVGFAAFRFLVSRRATAYIANSAATAETVTGFLREGQRVAVVPSPIGVPRADSVETAKAQGRVRIGMVARLDDWKGQAEVLRAFLRSGVSDRATLTFYGDASFGKESYAEHLRSLAAQAPEGSVSFAGFVSDVCAAVDESDVCVQYSLRPEPLGQNVLQYLARGKTVLAAAEGGPLEWVEDDVNGILVAPRDEDALADALRRVVDDEPLRARLGAAARDTASLPTDDAVAAEHARVFHHAATGEGA